MRLYDDLELKRAQKEEVFIEQVVRSLRMGIDVLIVCEDEERAAALMEKVHERLTREVRN